MIASASKTTINLGVQSVSKKMSRKLSSWRYSFRKTSAKIASYSPSPISVAILVVAISVFLLGGGMYDIFMHETIITILPLGGGRWLSFMPYRIHEQLLSSSIGVMILYALGAAGLLLVYHSTKYVRNPRHVSFLTKIGIALLLIAFISIEAVIFWKLNYQ
ncbi:hypothetical protein B6U79_01710 [Candidatus Bathyarchaeota archaeon ex4484_231]|nr:MAG: hypothetical protein B6U79_01710 [Candidatus Bathyarchaeota archaeon ex4484_231]